MFIMAFGGVIFNREVKIFTSYSTRFSNMSPEAKKSTFKDMIKKGSLKLRIMSEKTQGINASQQWKETICAQHEQEMLDLFTEGSISEEI